MIPTRPVGRPLERVRSSRPKESEYYNTDSDDSISIILESARDKRRSHYDSPSRLSRMVEVPPSNSHANRDRGSSHRRTSSIADDSTHHESGHRRRHRRRRRRSSESEDAYNSRTSPEKHDEPRSRQRRRSSVSSLPDERWRRSTSERISVGRPLKPETLQRVRSRKASAPVTPKNDPEEIIVEEVDESDREYTPRIRRRSASLKEKETRPSLVRSSTSARRTTKVSPLPTVREEQKSEVRKTPQRSNSVFGSLFGPPRPAVPEEKVSCLTCLDDVPSSKAPKLTCGHRMCTSCLKRIFTLSVTDPAHMPPKCCTEDCIPLKHVNKLFDDRFKMRWNRKYQEYTTKNRIYCPAKGCGIWIPPKDISRDKEGRKYGTCHRCKTQVCAKCNGKRHKSKECPKDDETQQFADMAKNNGWQRCYNCSATVELKEGCNHMTCRCTAQFCMICGSKWKTCNCPWFNYTTVNANRINNLNVRQVQEEMTRGGGAFAQPMAYQEEIDRRREQERQDEALARRMQGMDFGVGNRQWGGGWGGWGYFANQGPASPNAGGATSWLDEGFPLPDPFAGRPANPFNIVPVPGPAPGPAPPPQTDEQPPHLPPVVPDNLATNQRRPAPRRKTEAKSPEPKRRPSAIQKPRQPQGQKTLEPDLGGQAARSENQRSALLAGLNRASDNSRVDAWRRYVSGEPVVSPL